MTEPKPIDLSPLYSANIRAITNLSPDEMVEHLAGTDLKVDPKTGNVIADDKAKQAKDLFEQYAMVRMLIDAGGEDKKLDAKEAKALSEKLGLPGADPAVFMEHTQTLIQKRWGVISKNLLRWSAKRPINNLNDYLDVYNQGLYTEEMRTAERSFSPGKFALNVTSIGRWAGQVFGYDPKDLKVADLELARAGKFAWTDKAATPFVGDNFAIEQATENYVERSKAIAAFKIVADQALKTDDAGNWSWRTMPAQEGVAKVSAQEVLAQLKTAGDMEVTLGDEKHQISGADAAEILENAFPFSELFDIATTKELNQRYEKIMKFADEERPGFMGFGGGNAGNFDFMYNGTGVLNNLHFARSSLGFLVRRGGEEYRPKAMEMLEDMKGDGGGFGQWTYAGAANLVCGAAKLFTECEGPPLRTWSDEATIDGPDEFARNSIMLFGTYGGLRISKALNLAPMKRWGIWARANHQVMKGTKAVDATTGMAKVSMVGMEGAYTFKARTGLLAKIGVYTYLGGSKARKALFGWNIDRLTRGKPGLKKMGGRFGDALLAGCATYLADKHIVPQNVEKIVYDRNLDMRPLPVQDPAQMDWQDPLLKDYLKTQ